MNEQVQMQLDYLKYWVDSEIRREERCKKLKLPYVPSSRKWLDIELYNDYKKEIEENGDENLLVMVKVNIPHCTLNGKILPFARRYVYPSYGTYFLVHKVKGGAELLITEDEAKIISKNGEKL